MARSVQTWPSWWPFVNGPCPLVSDIYSSSLVCATTIASMWTISCVLLPPCQTFFEKVRFGAGLLSSSLHLTASRLHAYESSSPLYPCSWRAFCGEDGCIQYPHWGCAWAVWSTGCIFLCKLSPMECNYPVTDHELLAIFLAYQRWHCYLHGAESTVVYTDHKVLVHLFTQPLLNPLDMLGGEASWVPLGHTVHCWPCQHCCWWTLATTCYYQVAACLWSYHVLVFAWLVGIGCSACRSGLVHLCWCVRTSGILHALDPLLYQVPGIALVSWSVCYSQAHWAYLPVVLCCVYTVSCSSGQPLGGVRPWSCWWLACNFVAA